MVARTLLRLVRRGRSQGAQSANPEWSLRIERDTRDMQRLIRETLGTHSVCVDVGAHGGDFLRDVLAYAPHGRHIAVEPLPDMAARLRREFPGVTVHQCAAGVAAGSATFYRPVDRPAWSGLRRQAYPQATRVRESRVDVRSLDDLCAGQDVSLVKIDVEGAEFEVIRGAERLLLEQAPALIFEHAPIHSSAYGIAPEAIHDLLARLQYEIRGLDRSGPHDRERFSDLCREAHDSGYARDAQTNWLATLMDG